jgi:tight adherence protein C
MIWIVVGLTALTVILLVLGLAGISGSQTRELRSRLEELRTGIEGHRELQERRRRQEKRERLETLLEAVGERFAGDRARSMGNLQERLVHAGYRHPNAVTIFMGIRLLLAASLGGGVLLGSSVLQVGAMNVMVLAAFAGVLGWMLPFIWLRVKRNRRQNEIQRALPDALDLLVVCVEAGLGLNQALMRVSDEMDRISPILADELTIVSLQIRAGTPRQEALQNLGERTGISDVRSLVGMLVQTDRFGTSIANALRVHADTLRDKRRQRAEEQAAKLSIKMLFPLVAFIFPAIFVVLLGPAVFRLMEAFSGI